MSPEHIKINRAVLPNGLRVVHNHIPGSAMVTVDVLYDVGTRDEDISLTGMAHLFEHLMFGGSANAPDFEHILENAGGSNNAWTSNDFTNFHDTLPAVNLDTALFLESDRMLSLSFKPDTLEVQRSVVIEEFKQQCLNRPYGDLMHHLRAILYGLGTPGCHPYAWPTIGLEPGHIEKVTMEDVRRWFFGHYAPNNAVLAVCGGVEWPQVLERATHWFGDIPRRDIPARQLPSPVFPRQNTVKTIRGNVPTPLMVMAFPMSRYGTREYLAADILTDILSAGRSSRLRHDLVVNSPVPGLLVDVEASILGAEDEGFLMVDAVLAGGDEDQCATARQLILEALRKLHQPGNISEQDLERTFNNFESDFRFRNLSQRHRAESMALAEIHGEDLGDTVSRQRSITMVELRATAQKLFSDTPWVAINYLPHR